MKTTNLPNNSFPNIKDDERIIKFAEIQRITYIHKGSEKEGDIRKRQDWKKWKSNVAIEGLRLRE